MTASFSLIMRQTDKIKELEQQNKRYREVLQLITNRISLDDEYIPIEVLFEIKKIVDEALEK